MQKQRNARQLWWICAGLAAITFALFSPLIHYHFLEFDDQAYVTENPYVRSGLSLNSLAWAFHTSSTGNWIPLTWISHMLDVQCFGLNAGEHHFTNVLLHTVNVVLLFLLLQRMTGAVWRSAMVAALFGWHPTHVESVAWISERKDVLSALFWMLSLFAYVWHAAKSGWARYALSLALFALALMSKPMVVTLPFVLLLLDFWPLRRWSARSDSRMESEVVSPFLKLPMARLLMEKIPFFVLSAIGCVAAIWAQSRSKAVASTELLPVGNRVWHVFVSYLQYVGMLLAPHNLSIFYPYPLHENLGLILGGVVLLAGVSIWAFAAEEKRPYVLVGWLWFLGTLVPVIGLIQVGRQALADRYTYLPAIGLFVVVVWGLADFARRYSFVKILAPIAGVAMLVTTSLQIPNWKDTRTVFEHANQVTQNNFLAITLLGSIRANAGDWSGAMELYREALRIKPNYAEAHFFLARALDQQGKSDQAAAEYAVALRLNPSFQQAHLFFGLLMVREKNYDEAAAQYQAVLSINPQSAAAHNDLARLLQSEGRLQESLEHYNAALLCDPTLAEAHNNLGVLFLQKGQLTESAIQLRAALRLNPGNVETQFNLATVLNQQQQWAEALAILEKIAPAKSDNADLHYQFGLALEHAGQTREAMSQFANALLLAPDLAGALNELAWIASTDLRGDFRNGAQAVALAEKACSLTGRQQPDVLLTLAAAQAEAGRLKEAVATAQEAFDLAGTKGQKEAASKAQNMLETFRAGRPYRTQIPAPLAPAGTHIN